MTKLNLADADINDYLKFESLNESFGFPYGSLGHPGTVRYFRIVKKYPTGAVLGRWGRNSICFHDTLVDDNNIHKIKAQFPAIMQDWRLRVTLPTPQELPTQLRVARWLHNLRIIPWNITRISLSH